VTTMRRTNAEFDLMKLQTATLQRPVMWGRGCVYKLDKKTGPRPAWRMEWSSGSRKYPNSKVKRYGLNVRGSYADARQLLDWIVAVPYRNSAQALMVIAPYIEMIPASGGMIRVIKSPLPTEPSSRRQQKRASIQLEYWRMRLLDTIEAYRRYDD
jgi:hypothetical protein